MSRVSDTRSRTRETAARLVAAGRRPHELTVDLIYAEIRQGSRTTINDELKLWKDEQAKVQALGTALPPAVANAAMNLWAIAVEHGEKAFEQRREEVEGEIAVAREQVQSLETSLETSLGKHQEEIAGLRTDLAARTSEVEATRVEISRLRTDGEAARARTCALEQQLESSRAEAELRLDSTKDEYEQRLSELRGAMAAQEEAFRAEIGKATERLEAVQKQIMAQVTEARETIRHTEALLARAQERNEELSAQGQLLRTQMGSHADAQARAEAELATVSAKLQEMHTERESLLGQVALLTGKTGAQETQIEALERRAVGAETRLEAALKRSAGSRRKR